MLVQQRGSGLDRIHSDINILHLIHGGTQSHNVSSIQLGAESTWTNQLITVRLLTNQ